MQESKKSQIIEEVSQGSYVEIDGVMSPQTVNLINRFNSVGVDMSMLWALTPQQWICPACKRHKTEIARNNKNNALMCRLVEHHDHMRDLLKMRFEEISSSLKHVVADDISEQFAIRSASMVSSFENTVVCDDCNVADVNAKKAAKTDRWFSFSPQELGQIVIPRPNEPHEINTDIAKSIWSEGCRTFDLRIKVVNRIAEIAATDVHWFQPTGYRYRPDVIESRARSYANSRGFLGSLDFLVGEKPQVEVKQIKEWRIVKPKDPVQIPTFGQIEHVSKVKSKESWDKVDSAWFCPACNRKKAEIVRLTNKKQWSFDLAHRNYRDDTARHNVSPSILCNDCGLIAERIGKEARLMAGLPFGLCSSLVTVNEIKRLVIARPHARHEVDNEAADQLLEVIIRRLEPV